MYNGFTPTTEYQKAAARAEVLRMVLIELMGYGGYNRWANNLPVNTHLDRKEFVKACEDKMRVLNEVEKWIDEQCTAHEQSADECIDNGYNICPCKKCNTPMPSVDDEELTY